MWKWGYYNYQAKVLKELAKTESYVCVGRACDYILRDLPRVLKVFIYAPEELCIDREVARQGISLKEAEKYVLMNNKFRREYYNYHTNRIWESPYNYDICINTADYIYEQSVELIKLIIKSKYGIE